MFLVRAVVINVPRCFYLALKNNFTSTTKVLGSSSFYGVLRTRVQWEPNLNKKQKQIYKNKIMSGTNYPQQISYPFRSTFTVTDFS